MEVSAFLAERIDAQLEKMDAKLEAQRQETINLHEAVFEAKLREQALEMKVREAQLPQRACDAVSDEGLDALQARVQALYEAKLLTDDELGAIEDTIADCIEMLAMAAANEPPVAKVAKMVALSAKMKADAAFARQLRRKHC